MLAIDKIWTILFFILVFILNRVFYVLICLTGETVARKQAAGSSQNCFCLFAQLIMEISPVFSRSYFANMS